MKDFVQKNILILVLTICANTVFAQHPESGKGIEFYEKGDYVAAIAALKDTKDSKELYYLALSYEKIKQLGKAKEALTKIITKSYDVHVRHFLDGQKEDAQDGSKTFSEFLKQIQSDNEIGFLAAKKALEMDSNIFKGNELAFKADTLRKLILIAQDKEIIYSNTDKAISSVKILEKERPAYPKDLSGSPITRRNQSRNKPIIVALLMVFGADGEIKTIISVDPIIDAFTIEAWRAAAKIKFNPATINGKSVSSYRMIEYTFSIG